MAKLEVGPGARGRCLGANVLHSHRGIYQLSVCTGSRAQSFKSLSVAYLAIDAFIGWPKSRRPWTAGMV